MGQIKNILFRCDGSPDIGLGHLTRCFALADQLQQANIQICFAMRKGPLGVHMVEEKGYQVIQSNEPRDDFDYGEWLKVCVADQKANAVVFDVRDGLSRTVVRELRKSGVLTVTIDDAEDKRLEVDLAFYPPVPQVKRMDWTGFTGKLYSGWEWVILRPEFAAWRKKQESASISPITEHPSPPKILVTMGGSDPAGLTLKVVEALKMLSADFHAMIVVGPGFANRDSLNTLLASASYPYTIHENVGEMAPIMAEADIAIASFGVTAYELAAIGVPAIYLCLTEDHAESASAFVKADVAVSLGVFTDVSKEMIAMEAKRILDNRSIQSKFSDNAKKLIDGQGGFRISYLLIERLNAKDE